jgi:hypothetical protein
MERDVDHAATGVDDGDEDPTHGTEGTDAEDGGFVAVWVALSLTILLGMAGFATDLAHWYLTASRVQNAADASALAGVVYLPGNISSAQSIAGTIAGDHGYSTVSSTMPRPNQLRVTITKSVPTFFVKVLGINSVTVKRSALAEYEQPVAMGSPDPYIGNDPEQNLLPQYWLNVAGPSANKSNGDRYATKNCGNAGANEQCSTATTPNNNEYKADGYFFGVKSPGGNTLRVQLYDPAYVPVRDRCDAVNENDGSPDSDDNYALPLPAQLTVLSTWYPDAAQRYATGTTKWCTGDQELGNGVPPTTTVLVRAPDTTTWDDTDNPVVCTQRFPGYSLASGNPSVYQLLRPNDGVADTQAVRNPNDGVWTFAETFRQWATVCDIPGSVAGEYIVQVRTNAAANPPNGSVYDSTINTGGHNRFSMRVGTATGANGVTGTGHVAQARGRLPIYANNAATAFKAARVLPGGIGRTLQLELFDMGDSNNAGTLYIQPSADANISGFTGCVFTRSSGGAMAGANPSNCSVSGVQSSSGFDGRWITVLIPIPDTYTCNSALESGCWVTVRPDFSGGSPTDTTTWSASMRGSPVRLVE